MPYLPPEDRAILCREQDRTCGVCLQKFFKLYCRQCDEFYFDCACPESSAAHVGHRTYDRAGLPIVLGSKP